MVRLVDVMRVVRRSMRFDDIMLDVATYWKVTKKRGRKETSDECGLVFMQHHAGVWYTSGHVKPMQQRIEWLLIFVGCIVFIASP